MEAPAETAPPARGETKNDKNRRRLLEGSLSLGVLRFGGPLVVGMVLHTAYNLVDLFMISRLEEGSEAIAAIGVSDMIAAVATILSNGVSVASVALISRHLGSNNLRGVRRVSWQSLLLVGVMSLAFGAIGLFGANWVIRDVMSVKGAAADLGVGYLQIIVGGCYSIFFLLQVTSILRALGHAKTAASLLIGGNVANVFLNVLFIYGPGDAPEVLSFGPPIAAALGIPRLGVLGAAWATLIARTGPVLVGLVLILRRRSGPRFHPVYLRPFRKELRQLWELGWPSSAQLVVRVLATLFYIALLNVAYTTEEDQSALTAFSVCLRLETMVIFIGMGWGAAASSFVGTNLGAGNEARAKAAGWYAAGFNALMMTVFAALYLQYAEPIVGFFDDDPVVIEVATEYVRTVVFTYVAFGAMIVLSQAMTGAGATLQSLLVDSAVLGFIVVPAAYVIVQVAELPRSWLWAVIAFGNIAGMFAYGAYYQRGRFLQKDL
ncbi:MAG: MATE family efflux transporter [Myxococcota bacterium]